MLLFWIWIVIIVLILICICICCYRCCCGKKKKKRRRSLRPTSVTWYPRSTAEPARPIPLTHGAWPAPQPGRASLQYDLRGRGDHSPGLRPPDLPTLVLEHEDVIAEASESGNIPLGDVTRENRSVLVEPGQSESGCIKITKPRAVRGKLYNQDYKEITEKVFRTGILFKDKEVYTLPIFIYSHNAQ